MDTLFQIARIGDSPFEKIKMNLKGKQCKPRDFENGDTEGDPTKGMSSDTVRIETASLAKEEREI